MKFEQVLPVLALLGCVFITILDLAVGITGFASLTACTIFMCIILYPYRNTSLGSITLFSGTSLYIVAYAALLTVGELVNIAWFALFILVAYAMLASTVDPVTLENRGQRTEERSASVGNLALLPIILATAFAMSTLLSGTIAELSIGVGWAVSMLMLERLHWSTPSLFKRLVGASLIIVYLLVYAAFFWGGGGRLAFISLLLAPILLISYYGPWRVNGFVLAGLGAALVFVGRVMRFGWSNGLAGVAEDSGATHVGLTSELWRVPSLTGSATNLWEQYLLLFVNWLPREWWPGKPLGANYVFVDVYIGREGLGEEHSTALGYFGEHIYYSQDFWILGVVLTTVTIIALRRLLAKLSGPYITPVLMLDVWLLTLFWGGMAVFGSRLWFSLLPTLGLAVFLRWWGGRSTKQHRRSAGALARREAA
jgi:hypothetical protein